MQGDRQSAFRPPRSDMGANRVFRDNMETTLRKGYPAESCTSTVLSGPRAGTRGLSVASSEGLGCGEIPVHSQQAGATLHPGVIQSCSRIHPRGPSHKKHLDHRGSKPSDCRGLTRVIDGAQSRQVSHNITTRPESRPIVSGGRRSSSRSIATPDSVSDPGDTRYWDYTFRLTGRRDVGHHCRECKEPFAEMNKPIAVRRWW